MQEIKGFSKLDKEQKISWLMDNLTEQDQDLMMEFKSFWHQDHKRQKIIDDFSENVVSNFVVPFSIAPNFFINGELKCLPMAIEESSVVAAAARSAKFWLTRGGFKAEVLGTIKTGHVHLNYPGDFKTLNEYFLTAKNSLLESIKPLEKNMKKRGGGVVSLELIDYTHKLKGYYALELKAETCNAMGANFLNSLLEKIAQDFEKIVPNLEIVMAILTNYTDECLVKASVKSKISDLNCPSFNMPADVFANKFKRAIDIARVNPKRAVTHNKGIFNGVDALVLATGNDFRAIEACAHAYAARDGEYQSLSKCQITDDAFEFELTMPIAVGTIGGLTKLHPMAKKALVILGNPSAKELMMYCGVLGLAQNFAAVSSLVTTGIQKGHMKMHLLNILNQLKANPKEISLVKNYFNNKVISFASVSEYLKSLRSLH